MEKAIGRMPDPQSRVLHWFEFHLLLVSELGHFRSLHDAPYFSFELHFEFMCGQWLRLHKFRISHNYCISLHHKKYAYLQTNDMIIALPGYKTLALIIKLWSLVCLDERVLLHCVK